MIIHSGEKRSQNEGNVVGKCSFLVELFRSKTVKQVTYHPKDARRSGHDNLHDTSKFLIDVCCTCIMSDNVLAVGLF